MVKNWSKVIPRVIPIFSCSCKSLKNKADVAELADAHDLGSCSVRSGGSSPLIRTSHRKGFRLVVKKPVGNLTGSKMVVPFVGRMDTCIQL